MSVDLIVGVMTAADPAKLRSVTSSIDARDIARSDAKFGVVLKRANGQIADNLASQREGSDLVADVMKNAKQDKLALAIEKLGDDHRVARVDSDPRSTVVLNQLEGTLLANFLDAIIPQTKGGFFGDDAGANFWRGMQVQTMSQAMSGKSILGLDHMIDVGSEQKNAALGQGLVTGEWQERKIRPFAFPKNS